jgi:hypothetical protein
MTPSQDLAGTAISAVTGGVLSLGAAVLSGIDPTAGYAVAAMAGSAPPLATVFVEGWRSRIRRADVAAAEGSSSSGTPLEVLINNSISDPTRLALSMDAFDAAMRSALDAKVVALGRSWAAGVNGDDGTAAQEHQFIRSIARLELPGIRVLDVLTRDYRTAPQTATALVSGWTPLGLASELPEYSLVIQPVLGLLVSEGLAMDSAIGGPNTFSTREEYGITDYGRWVLDRLSVSIPPLAGHLE